MPTQTSHLTFPEDLEASCPFPLPSGALSLSLSASGDLVVYIPPAPGHTKGHSAILPASTYGLQALLTLLRDRQKAPQGKIGTRSAPTSFMLTAYANALANGRPIHKEEKPRPFKASDIDDILSDLSLEEE